MLKRRLSAGTNSDPVVDSHVTAAHLSAALSPRLSKRVIAAQLDRILASTVFIHSERLSRMLRFAVQQATEGNTEQLKEYALAISVFDKRDSFDPRFDPIVRVEAGRLRTRLKQYYETEGRNDQLVIDLPKGSYVPRFVTQSPETQQNQADPGHGTHTYSANSIAVLPFADHSPDRDQEYFCDGMTEELINALTKLRGLRVAAWTSALKLRGETHDVAKIGEQLKVGTVVAGSVRKAGDRLRITVQLIGTRDGSYLWSEIYDRQVKDVFAIQEEISQAIVAMLKVQIAGGQSQYLVRRYTENVEAYTLYLKGRYCWNQRSEQSLKKGIEYFGQAIVHDPKYAPAYSGLADSYSLLGNSGVLPAKEVKAKAMWAALKAVELDPTLAEAHTALGHVRATYCWDWQSACAEYRTAIALNPAYATVHHWNAITYLSPQGLLENALTEIQKAEELDPVSISIKRDIAVILYYGRRYEQAVAQCRKTIELEPAFSGGYWALGLAYEGLCQYADAVNAFEQALNVAPHTPRLLGALGHAYGLWGKRSEALKMVEQMTGLAGNRYVAPFDFALVHLGLGAPQAAFEWLEQAHKARSYELVALRVDPRFDPVRSDAKFAKLLKRLGLQNPVEVPDLR
jgi:TolB-like protein/Flp pilus assembly protein TadD